MEPHESPDRHEIGPNPITGKTYLVADVEPLDVDGVRTVAIGSVLWVVGLVALLPFSGRLMEDARGWWLFTCLAGAGLGLIGLEYCRRLRTARVVAESDDAERSGTGT